MQIGTQQHQPKNHEQNRQARAAAIVEAARLFEKKHKTPAAELVREASAAEWHYLLKISYQLSPIESREEEQPSEELKALVRFAFEGVRPIEKAGNCPCVVILPATPGEPTRTARCSLKLTHEGNCVPRHSKDEHCAECIDKATMRCSVCGVDHSGECPACGGKGFHVEGCAESEEQPSKEVR